MTDGPSLTYRLFGYFIRRDACRLSAHALSSLDIGSVGLTPGIWSLTVFYESYLMNGSSGTAEDFGPKDPVDLAEVRSGDAA